MLLSTFIKGQRKLLGLSQEAFARKIGVSCWSVTSYEIGKIIHIRKRTKSRIAKKLKIDVKKIRVPEYN